MQYNRIYIIARFLYTITGRGEYIPFNIIQETGNLLKKLILRLTNPLCQFRKITGIMKSINIYHA